MQIDDELISILDYILNKAGMRELDAVQKAVEKKINDLHHVGTMKFNPSELAHKTSLGIQNQIGQLKESMRAMIQRQVRDIIEQQAPELKPEQVNELLETWIPDREKNPMQETESNLSGDVLYSMAGHFIDYSLNRMPAQRQNELHQAIPNWQEKYWKLFPISVQKLINVFLKEKIDEQTFWETLKTQLHLS